MRSCGGCTLCCKLIPVEELSKPGGKRCAHQRSGKGCAIYDKRPMSCREWSCLWLAGVEDDGPLDLSRPDRSHYVIDSVPDVIRARDNVTGEVRDLLAMQIWVDPLYPHAHRDPALRAMLDRQRIVALVRYSEREGFALFPPSQSHDGRWHEKECVVNESLQGTRRQARFDFWDRQAKAQSLMGSSEEGEDA